MQALRSCPSCRRHHGVDESVCPFCGVARRLGGVVPALAMLGLTACPVRTVYAGPPPQYDRPSNEQLEPASSEGEAPETESRDEAAQIEAAPLERAEGDAEASTPAEESPSED